MKIWNTKFAHKIDEINNRFENEWYPSDFINKMNDLNQKLLEARTNVKNQKKEKIKKILTLSAIFKRGEYKNETISKLNNYEQELNNVINEKLNHHKSIFQFDIFKRYQKEIFNILNTKYVGVPNVKLIKELGIEEWFIQSQESNTYNSCWYIYDYNKILLNLTYQNHKITMREYSGSVTVRRGDKSYTITAYYSHPEPIVSFDSKVLLFMKELKDLNFEYRGLDPKLFRKARIDKSEIPFENPEFEKTFDWTRSNETQIRMLFTPLAQETYVNEVKSYNEKGKIKNVEPEDQYKKKHCFLFNEVNEPFYSEFLANTFSTLNNFCEDPDANYEEMIQNFKQICLNRTYNFFKSTKYLYMFESFVSSINNKNEINNIIKNSEYQDNVIFFILTRLIRRKFANGFYEPFYTIESIDNSSDIKSAIVNLLTYDRIQKTTYVWKDGVSVPIDYFDYIPYNTTVPIYYSFLEPKINNFFRGSLIGFNHVEINRVENQEILNRLVEYYQNGIEIIIEKNIITAIANSDGVSTNDLVNAIDDIKNLYRRS